MTSLQSRSEFLFWPSRESFVNAVWKLEDMRDWSTAPRVVIPGSRARRQSQTYVRSPATRTPSGCRARRACRTADGTRQAAASSPRLQQQASVKSLDTTRKRTGVRAIAGEAEVTLEHDLEEHLRVELEWRRVERRAQHRLVRVHTRLVSDAEPHRQPRWSAEERVTATCARRAGGRAPWA